MFSQTCGFVEG